MRWRDAEDDEESESVSNFLMLELWFKMDFEINTDITHISFFIVITQ